MKLLVFAAKPGRDLRKMMSHLHIRKCSDEGANGHKKWSQEAYHKVSKAIDQQFFMSKGQC